MGIDCSISANKKSYSNQVALPSEAHQSPSIVHGRAVERIPDRLENRAAENKVVLITKPVQVAGLLYFVRCGLPRTLSRQQDFFGGVAHVSVPM